MGRLTPQPMQLPPTPAIVGVDDFDIHNIHIEEHNKFRMGQQYEMLPDEIKQQFEAHVNEHEALMQQQQLESYLSAMPPGGAPGTVEEPPTGGDQMAGNGSVPAPEATGGGEFNG